MQSTTKRGFNGAPQRLGRYVIEKRIGKGAMGAVYQARDPRINRAVALKAIPIEKEFEDEELKVGPFYPAVSLLHNAGCTLVSGKPPPFYFFE